MFKGVYTALVTPFKNDKIDFDALERIIEMQIDGGVDGVVPMGTTGESPTVSFSEHKEFIKKVVELVKGRAKVIAGTGANSTVEAVHLTRAAEEDGVDGVLLVTPYYNKPPQRGMIAHFERIAKSVSVPIILYNIPGRTGIDFFPESLKELISRVDNIVSIKEATGSIANMMQVMELCGDRLTLLSGDDNLLLPVLAIGGSGIISVVSNFLPRDVKNVIELYAGGRVDEARRAFYKLLPLCKAMFLETNPIPVKAAMEMTGYCSSDVRLPLVPLSDENRAKLRNLLIEYGVDI